MMQFENLNGSKGKRCSCQPSVKQMHERLAYNLANMVQVAPHLYQLPAKYRMAPCQCGAQR